MSLKFSGANGKIICKKIKFAKTFFEKFKGLMLESEKNFDYALIFVLGSETRIGASVHMLFVFFPIDIIFLDENKKVVDKASLKPWVLNYTPKKPAKYLIEMPKSMGNKIKIGDKLEW
jgi:hypothetical protein